MGISTGTLGTAWQIFAASHYGVGRFELSAPTILPPPNRFRLTFHLLSWRWQLVGIRFQRTFGIYSRMQSSKLCASASNGPMVGRKRASPSLRRVAGRHSAYPLPSSGSLQIGAC